MFHTADQQIRKDLSAPSCLDYQGPTELGMDQLLLDARLVRNIVEDPYTWRRLVFFLCIHLLAFCTEIAAIVIFVHTQDYQFVPWL